VTWALITACARRRAAVGDAHALGVLSELMEHETAHVRASALEATYALSDPESPPLMEALSRSLEDGSILVRTAAQVQSLPFTEQHASMPSSCVWVFIYLVFTGQQASMYGFVGGVGVSGMPSFSRHNAHVCTRTCTDTVAYASIFV
jgi:hypothetical protein